MKIKNVSISLIYDYKIDGLSAYHFEGINHVKYTSRLSSYYSVEDSVLGASRWKLHAMIEFERTKAEISSLSNVTCVWIN